MTTATNSHSVPTITKNTGRILDLCRRAVRRSGGDPATADALARSAVYAEGIGKAALGILHLFDYLDALREGRINPAAKPSLTQVTPIAFSADADGGVPHVPFESAVEQLVAATQHSGLAFLSTRNAYTAGALGYFVERMAARNLIALAGANSSPLMSAGGSAAAVLGTNPLAFAAPLTGNRLVVMDQASSQTAFVNVREHARTNEPIPSNWALDGAGVPTTDPVAALGGALLPFGGYKGANIALIVEILSAMSGANWSVDAPPFDTGNSSPAIGMYLLCIEPSLFDPDFTVRLSNHLERLRGDYQVRVPGWGRTSETIPPSCTLPRNVFERLWAAAG